MRMRILLLVCACTSLVLPMCQEASTLMAPGCVQAADPEADAMLQEARSYMAQGKYRKARSVLKRLFLYHPAAPCVPEAQFAMAQSYDYEQDYREAFKRYSKVIESQHGSPLYTAALNRQLELAKAAVEGTLKVDVFWGAWRTEMDSSVVRRWLMSIIKNAPYNDMSAQALSLYGHYLQRLGYPDEACAIYAKLAEKYPTSPYAPDAQLESAAIWASSSTRGDNNHLVTLHKALEAYEEFTLRFPKHPDVAKAKAEIARIKSSIVKQQLEMGRYYLNRSHDYSSAVFCFEDVIRQAAINPAAAEEARQLLPQAKLKLASPR